MIITWSNPSEKMIELSIKGMRLSHSSNSYSKWYSPTSFDVHEKDMDLMKRLVKAGDSHALFMRFLHGVAEIKAPRYWWQEFDRYRFGVERMSESTMHTILKRPLNKYDFAEDIAEGFIDYLNTLVEDKNFIQLKRNLPEGFLQFRIVKCSYQAIRNMYLQRKHHRLPEWEEFIESMNVLKLSELIFVGDSNE